jgi:hypothetical protein
VRSMNGKAASALSAANRLTLRSWKRIILPRGWKADEQLQVTARCSVGIVTGGKAANKYL